MKKFLLGLLFSVLTLGGAFIAHQTFAAEQIDNTPDCDTVAIVRCGSMTESAVRSNATKGDVSKVYAAFGISQSELNGSFVSGVVWKDGRVTLGSRTVATGATTAGRWNNPKSGMTRIAGTDRAYKMSTSHFVTSGQTAWLKFDANGKFLFAIIKSCGNPVVAKPVVPTFVCNSLTATRISRVAFKFTAKATVTNATIVSYTYNFGDGTVITTPAQGPSHTYAKPGTYTATLHVNVKLNTTGQVKTITGPNCDVKVPVAPAPAWSCNSLTFAQISRNQYKFTTTSGAINGAKITAHTFDYGDGQRQTIQTVGNNTTQAATHTYAKPGTYTIRATQTVLSEGAVKYVTSDKCVVKVTVTPEPTYSCDELKFSPINRNTYMFTAKGSAANGATITGYTFNYGDGKSDIKTTPTASHAYTAPGTYTAKVTLTVKVGTATKTVEGPKCVVKVTVAPEAKYSCDELTKTQIARNKYSFAAKATAENGATIAKYNFNYGDGQNEDVTTDAKTATREHTYAQAGEYTVRVTVYVTVNGQTIPVTSDKCVVKVTVAPEASYSCDELTKNQISRTNFGFTAKASAANGAAITKYTFDFGDGKTADVVTAANTASTAHTYTEAREYTIRVTAYVSVNGQVVPATSDKCVVKVVVEKEETPVYKCDALSAQLIGEKADRNFKYTLSYTATGGATLRDVDFNFGDSTPVQNVKPAELANVSHKYAADGEYTTVATLHFNANNTVVDQKCEVKVNPANPPVECKPGIPVGDVRCNPEECKPGVPVGHPDCEEKCPIPGKEHLPKDSKECVEEGHVLPATLPSTGPGAILSGLVGSSAIGYGAYSYLASRRALKNAMKN